MYGTCESQNMLVKMNAEDIIKAISALGVGSGLGAIITSVLAARSTKGKSRAEAADLLVGAAERVGKMNASLDEEVRELRANTDAIFLAMFDYLGENITREELLAKVKELRR